MSSRARRAPRQRTSQRSQSKSSLMDDGRVQRNRPLFFWVAPTVFYSIEPKQRWETDDNDRGPKRVRRQVGCLPALQAGKGAAAAQKPNVEHRGPAQVHQQDHVLAECGDSVG